MMVYNKSLPKKRALARYGQCRIYELMRVAFVITSCFTSLEFNSGCAWPVLKIRSSHDKVSLAIS